MSAWPMTKQCRTGKELHLVRQLATGVRGLFVPACLLLVAGLPALAVTAADVQKLVEDSHVLAADYRVSATVRDQEAAVSTYRNPKAGDNDCKIEAVLIARVIMTAEPDQIKRVRLRFYSQANRQQYHEVMVRAGDIKAFASGQLKQDELLASLNLESGGTMAGGSRDASLGSSGGSASNDRAVAEGPMKTERCHLLDKIKALQEHGVGVRPFMEEFDKLNGLAQHGDRNQVGAAIDVLSNRVSEQDKAAIRARGGKEGAAAVGTKGGGGLSDSSFKAPDSNDPQAWRQAMADTYHKALKERYGWLVPEMHGPRAVERFTISKRLLDMKHGGYDVEGYSAYFKEMEALAAHNQQSLLDTRITSFSHFLGMPNPLTDPVVQKKARKHEKDPTKGFN